MPSTARDVTPGGVVTASLDLDGLNISTGTGTVDRGKFWMHTTAAGGCSVLLVGRGHSPTWTDTLIAAACRQSDAPQAAATRAAELWRQSGCDSFVLIGVWDSRQRVLGYFAGGFEAPSVVNVGWPHLSEQSVVAETPDGPSKMSFGGHHLAIGERWLLYTTPLVAVPDPERQPFNAVGLVEYARDGGAGDNERLVEQLMHRGLTAHGGAFPEGSLLVSIFRRPDADGGLTSPG